MSVICHHKMRVRVHLAPPFIQFRKSNIRDRLAFLCIPDHPFHTFSTNHGPLWPHHGHAHLCHEPGNLLDCARNLLPEANRSPLHARRIISGNMWHGFETADLLIQTSSLYTSTHQTDVHTAHTRLDTILAIVVTTDLLIVGRWDSVRGILHSWRTSNPWIVEKYQLLPWNIGSLYTHNLLWYLQ